MPVVHGAGGSTPQGLMRLFGRQADEREAAIRDGSKVEQPTSAKPETIRFNIGSLTKAKGGRVIHTGRLWSKEV